MTKEEIQKRFNKIDKKRRQARGGVCLLILRRDGFLEDGKNDIQIRRLDEYYKDIRELIVDMAKD